jgi:hypothetical protein
MSTVCFTGKGMSGDILVTRAQWEEQARAAGMTVVAKVGKYSSADYLVASRTDTVKANDARANENTTVLTYENWLTLIAGQVVRVGLPDNRPHTRPRRLPPDNSALEEIEGWGSF